MRMQLVTLALVDHMHTLLVFCEMNRNLYLLNSICDLQRFVEICSSPGFWEEEMFASSTDLVNVYQFQFHPD